MSDEILENSVDEGLNSPSEKLDENTGETDIAQKSDVIEDKNSVNEDDRQEKIIKTKKELDAEFAKAKRIAERRGRIAAERSVQEKLQQELLKFQEQQRIQQAQNVNSYWDENLQRNIPGNMTVEEYSRLMSGQSSPQSQHQPQQVQQSFNAQNSYQPQNIQYERFSDKAEDQAIECDEDFPDFQKVLKDGMPTVTMVNSVAQDPNGIKNLYLKMKEDPTFASQISRLSPQDQQHRMWQLNQEMSTKISKKIVSKATPQPAPIKGAGKVHVSEDDMSISELRRLRRQQDDAKRRGN